MACDSSRGSFTRSTQAARWAGVLLWTSRKRARRWRKNSHTRPDGSGLHKAPRLCHRSGARGPRRRGCGKLPKPPRTRRRAPRSPREIVLVRRGGKHLGGAKSGPPRRLPSSRRSSAPAASDCGSTSTDPLAVRRRHGCTQMRNPLHPW
jgi:hypothetical protein